MDFAERQRLVRRITSGKLYGTVSYHQSPYDVVFTDPSEDVKAQADWIYTKFYNRAKELDSFTLEESYQILRDSDKWGDKQEEEMLKIQEEIDVLNEKMGLYKYNKTAQAGLKTSIKRGQEKLIELYRTKNQLAGSSIEHLAEIAKQTFIVSKITQPNDLIAVPSFQEILRVYYFEENGIAESRIRELARTDPWRLYWTTSKDTGTSLFPHSAVEITDLQYLLVLWTKIYDFAYESSNRPTDDIINDDAQFDSWYQCEVKKRNAEIKQAEIENSVGVKGQEVFIVADKEGAKEIYAMNNAEARHRIKQRESAIKKHGSVKEINLPDIKQDLIMEANKKGSDAIQNRS